MAWLHSRINVGDCHPIPGGDAGGATPVPIPNTEVKPSRADGTALVTAWESRSLPGLIRTQRGPVGPLWRFWRCCRSRSAVVRRAQRLEDPKETLFLFRGEPVPLPVGVVGNARSADVEAPLEHLTSTARVGGRIGARVANRRDQRLERGQKACA